MHPTASTRRSSKSLPKDPTTRIIEIARGKNGYGFTLSGQAPSFVSWIVHSSPADLIGLRVGDYVLSVNGNDVSKSDHEEVVRLIGISQGTLFLGVSQTLEVLRPNDPPSAESSSVEQPSPATERKPFFKHSVPSFSRTDKVLKDLHSGEIFKSMSSPTSSHGEKKLPEEDGRQGESERHVSDALSSMLLVQSIVAYLGTIEMPSMEAHMVAQASLDAVRDCVQRLRVEQHIHQRVLLKVMQSGINLYNADGDTIAVYRIDKLKFSVLCPDDARFFCLVTLQDSKHAPSMTTLKTSCHVFMVDPEISMHQAHKEKAKRFRIDCSTNEETGDCVEFPKTPRSILAVIRLLQSTVNEQSSLSKFSSKSQLKDRASWSSTIVDSGMEHSCGDFTTSLYHIIDYHPSSNLTRGSSSLPPSALHLWSRSADKGKRKKSKERQNSSCSSGTDDSSRLNPRALFPSEAEASKNIHKAGAQVPQTRTSTSSSSSAGFQTMKAASQHKPRSSTSSSKLTQHNAPLNQQNLMHHDNRMKQNNQNSNNSRIPPPMHKLSMGKYKIPELRNYAELNRHFKRHEKGKTPFMMHSHQPSKRDGRSIASRLVAMGKAISRSTENVAISDEDPISGASSVESLASNASLPSCMSGSTKGNFDYGTHRASLRAANPNQIEDLAAGRISHWAVSFDRLLDDPLGVRYFKEFLQKEFSEENILFWEACEDLRRISAADSEALRQSIQEIYDRFLAHDAPMSINIDSEGQQLAEEALVIEPHPDAFLNQQHQVYTLMKLDSYSRFLKSSLFRQCMVCEMEGRPLPLESQDAINSDSASADSSSYPGQGHTSSSVEAGFSSFRRKDKKSSKSSKKSLFGFKHRPKGASQREKTSGGRDSSRDSSGSESYFSGGSASASLVRSGSLPTSVPDFPDPSRVCHVTLWDETSTVIYAKKSGVTTVAEALENLCERRGVKLSAVEVYIMDDFDPAQQRPQTAGSGANGKQRRPLSLDLDVSVLASRSIVLERRALFRLDMLPVRRSVGVKARPSKTISDALKSVLYKYNLQLHDMQVKISGESNDLRLDQPVSKIDGMRIVLERKRSDVNSKGPEKEKKDKLSLRRNLSSQKVSSVKATAANDRADTEELFRIMSTLQSSKLNDQRGLISKADLELPDFLKLPNANSNANNNVSDDPMTSPTVLVIDNVSPGLTSPPYSFSSNGYPSSTQLNSDTGGEGSKRKKAGRWRPRGVVELNSQPRTLSTFKSASLRRPLTSDRSSVESDEGDDLNDTTIVEDPDIVSKLGLSDMDMTICPLPTPPHNRPVSERDSLELSMADFAPPTPIARTTKPTTDSPSDTEEEENKTIMV